MQDGAKEQIGNYELLELIGDGAQGKVFKARRLDALSSPEKGNEWVAIKVLRLTGDEKHIKRLHQQASILQHLHHPNIVRYVDFFTWRAGEWDEAHCLVMEYLDGETLQDRIGRAPGGMPWSDAKVIFEQTLDALIYARGQSVVHRDIKPSNIFLTNEGNVKLIDFDIARREDSEQSTAGWKGTFDYMAPDFVTVPDFHGDEQSDVFSLGVCLYQALAGQLPLSALGEGAHIGYLNRWREASPAEFSYKASAFRVLLHAKHVVSKSISPSRDARYKTFAEMLEDIRKIRYRTLEDKNKDIYELTDIIGKGGFGEVFKGRRVRDGLSVAVKRLFAAQYSDRFLKEARILKKYTHPALVRYIDFIEAPSTGGEKQYFLILEYLEGMPQWSLRNRLKKEKNLSVEEVIPLFCRYLDALQFLHENPKPIVHRDIKPSNLYAPVGQPDQGKLFDLGVARDVTGTATSGGIPGTLDYMAPEFAQEGSERGSPQSDIYSLALCFYEALVGRPIFEKLPPDVSAAWMQFKERSATPHSIDFSDDVFQAHPRLKQIISRALAQQPSDRYSTAADMIADLAQLAGGASATHSGDTMITASTVFSHPDLVQAALREASTAKKSPPKKRPLLKALVAIIAFAVFFFVALRYEAYLPSPKEIKPRPKSTVVVAKNPDVKTQQDPFTAELKELDDLAKRIGAMELSADYVSFLNATHVRLDELSKLDTRLAEKAAPLIYEVVRQQDLVPSQFADAVEKALGERHRSDAEKILAEWQKLDAGKIVDEVYRQMTIRMESALSGYRLAERLAEIVASIPPGLAIDKDFVQAEKAAVELSDCMSATWSGLSEEEKALRIMPVLGALGQVFNAYLATLQKNAERVYQEGRDDVALQRDLKRLREQAPMLIQLFDKEFSILVDQLAKLNDNRNDFAKQIASWKNEIPEQIKKEDDVAGVEKLIEQIQDAEKTAWATISERERNELTDEIRQTCQTRMTVLVDSLRQAGLKKCEAGEGLDRVLGPMNELAKKYPKAMGLVDTAYKKAVEDIETQCRQLASVASKNKPAKATKEEVKTDTSVSLNPVETAALKVFKAGAETFRPSVTSPTVDLDQFNAMLAAAKGVKQEYRLTDRFLSEKETINFLAATDELWTRAVSFGGPFGRDIRQIAWDTIHTQLVLHARKMISGELLLRAPAQQAKIRRDFLKLLARIEGITGRLADCPANDPLRVAVLQYFDEAFFPETLLNSTPEDYALESKIPWLKAELDRVRKQYNAAEL